MNRIVLVIAALGLIGLIIVRQVGGGGAALTPKEALDANIAQVKGQRKLTDRDETRLRIELAMSDFMVRNGKPPSQVSELVPTYFDTVPIDPLTQKPFELNSDEQAPSGRGEAGTQVASASSVESIFAEGAFVNPNTMKESEFVYDPTSKRDPFDPFDFSGQNAVDTSLPPLERYSIGQLKVTAILRDTKDGGFYAFIEDATGIGYPAKKGTRVGDSNGIVVRINEDAVFVVESATDFTGKTTRKTVEMKIQRNSSTDKNANYQRIRNRKGNSRR